MTARRRWVGRALLIGGAVLAAGAGWAEWVQLGERRRSSHEMFRSLQALGLDVLDPVRLVWWWVPIVAGAVGLAVVAGRDRLAAAVAAVLAAIVGVAAIAVLTSGVAAGAGPWLAIVGAGTLVVGIVTMVQGRG